MASDSDLPFRPDDLIAVIQLRLARLGLYQWRSDESQRTDTEETRNAVKAFQAKFGLEANGVLDTKT